MGRRKGTPVDRAAVRAYAASHPHPETAKHFAISRSYVRQIAGPDTTTSRRLQATRTALVEAYHAHGSIQAASRATGKPYGTIRAAVLHAGHLPPAVDQAIRAAALLIKGETPAGTARAILGLSSARAAQIQAACRKHGIIEGGC